MRTVDLEKLRPFIESVVSAEGYELVEIEWKNEGGWVLRVYIDRATGVSLDDCAKVSHLLSANLDVSELIAVSYNLEVSSPGLNRPLRKESDFQRFIGKKAKIRTRRPVGGPDPDRRNFAGTLLAVEGGRIRIDVGDKTYEVPVDEVEKANLVYEF